MSVRLRSGVVTQVLNGEMVLLDATVGRYYDLNASGTLMLQQLLDGADPEATVAEVTRRFDAPAERVRADLAALLQALQAAQLIEADQPA